MTVANMQHFVWGHVYAYNWGKLLVFPCWSQDSAMFAAMAGFSGTLSTVSTWIVEVSPGLFDVQAQWMPCAVNASNSTPLDWYLAWYCQTGRCLAALLQAPTEPGHACAHRLKNWICFSQGRHVGIYTLPCQWASPSFSELLVTEGLCGRCKLPKYCYNLSAAWGICLVCLDPLCSQAFGGFALQCLTPISQLWR